MKHLRVPLLAGVISIMVSGGLLTLGVHMHWLFGIPIGIACGLVTSAVAEMAANRRTKRGKS